MLLGELKMSRFSKLFDAIHALELNHKSPDMIPPVKNFPYKQMYRAQGEIITAIGESASGVLCSHTGFGKTAIFITLTRGKAALIIEPRIFLQQQVAAYANDTMLFGRSRYTCPLSPSKTAAMAPCLAKVECDGTTYHDTCPNANNTCLNKPCSIFEVNGEWHQYPCDRCEYNDALRKARGVLTSGGCIVANFGNFWPFVKSANVIVVDEAGLFFKEISKPMKLKYTKPKDVI